MKTEVDNYRGWEIFFDTDTEKFTAYSNSHDTEIEKGSYSSIKKGIDEFIKENETFKTFYAEPTPGQLMYNGKKIKVIGIRKDGIFIYEDVNGKKRQLSKYDESRFMLINPENEAVLKKYNEMKTEADLLRDEANRYLNHNCKIKTLEEYRKEL